MKSKREINIVNKDGIHQRYWQLLHAGFISMLALLTMIGTAQSQTNVARVFRLVFSERNVSDKAVMYSSITNLHSRKAILHFFTNATTRLTERDVIIMEIEHHGEKADPVTRFRWSLASACKTTGAQLYDFDDGGVVTNRASAICEMSVLYWKSPFTDPRNLSKTEFYLDEKFTGSGEEGLKAAVDKVVIIKARYLGLVGSRYNEDSGYGPDEDPFYDVENIFTPLKVNGITIVRSGREMVFFAEGEDFYYQKNNKR